MRLEAQKGASGPLRLLIGIHKFLYLFKSAMQKVLEKEEAVPWHAAEEPLTETSLPWRKLVTTLPWRKLVTSLCLTSRHSLIEAWHDLTRKID
jgi:hypothetical protein